MKLNIPTKDNNKLQKAIQNIRQHKELDGYLRSANVTAMDRLQYSDHGPTHTQIVANAALKILRILSEREIPLNLVEDYEMTREDSEVLVVLGSVLHDIGMAIHRKDHDIAFLTIGYDLLKELLNGVYEGEEKAIMISEILGSVYTHNGRAKPLTVESGILAIADALDMAEGRARIPFEAGKIDIHSISAISIKNVEIKKGGENEKPVQIKIQMKNDSGIFQVDELLKKKVNNSGLEQYFNIVAEIGEEEEVLKKFEL